MSLALPEIHEHRVPSAATVLTPNICDNCARRLYTKHNGRCLCPDCVALLEPGAQIWDCDGCRRERVWGFGRPEETRGKRLRCLGCHQVTPHSFVRVAG